MRIECLFARQFRRVSKLSRQWRYSSFHNPRFLSWSSGAWEYTSFCFPAGLSGPWGDRSSGDGVIGDLGLMIDDLRFSSFPFQFSISNGFIFSPETVDKRCGGVCHAGVGSQGRPSSSSSKEPRWPRRVGPNSIVPNGIQRVVGPNSVRPGLNPLQPLAGIAAAESPPILMAGNPSA